MVSLAPSIITNTLPTESSNPTHIQHCPKKRIIVACDGTWMNADSVKQVPSNITRIIRSIPSVGVDNSNPAHPTPISQITFYQNGIGTGHPSWYSQYIGSYVSGVTGEGLSTNIREAYAFICNNYHRGDEIIILGYSRGAFTARSISKLINQLGLLTPKGLSYIIELCNDWEHQNDENWKSPYQEPWPDRPCFSDPAYQEKLRELRLTRENIPVKCVGVWDTVGSLGVPMIALFPRPAAREFVFVDTRVEDNIEYAFQALGLDEKRRSYSPSIWFKPTEQKFPRILKQTWFPGVHADIGGSYDNDDIANITLAWMVGQLEENKLVTFNREYLIRQVHRSLHYHEKARQAELQKQQSLQPSPSIDSPMTLKRAETFGTIRPWGLGKIHDSYTLFFRIGGALIRTPMEHLEYNRETMKPTGNLLKGTYENMHASVRVRMALDGNGYNDCGKYVSDALKEWSYEWKKDTAPDTPWQVSHPGEVGRMKGVEWFKTVTLKSADGKHEIKEELYMPEDTMTEIERIVLRHWTAGEDEWEEGADEREDVLYSARPMSREIKIDWDTVNSLKRPRRVGTMAPLDEDSDEDEKKELVVEAIKQLHIDTNLS